MTAILPKITVLNVQSCTIKHMISRLPLGHLEFYAPKTPLILIPIPMTYTECVEHYLHTLYATTWQRASELQCHHGGHDNEPSESNINV